MANLNAFPTYTVNVAVAATTAERVDSLDGIITTTLESWVLAAVKSGTAEDRLFYLDKADNTTVPDGLTVILPLQGAGRWKLLVVPVGAACPPLTRVLYVDRSTTVLPADQTGSICAPYDSIQDALDNTIPIGDPGVDSESAFAGNIILVAPGIYDENPVIPETTSVSMQGLGGMPNSLLLGGSATVFGPSVLVFDPAFLTTRTVSISYADLDGSTPARSVPPLIQFVNIALDQIDTDADGSDPALLANATQTYDNCFVSAWNDVVGGDKYDALVDIRDSFFDEFTGDGTAVSFEHSVGVVFQCDLMSAHDSVIDDLDTQSDDDNFVLIDTTINVSLGGSPVRLTTETSFFAEELGSLPPSQIRRVQDNLATAFHHQTITDTTTGPFAFDRAISCVFRLNATPGVTTLPLISLVRETVASTGQVCEQRIVKNMSGSGANTTVTPQSGDTIDGAANFPLPPGEGIVLVPQSASNWEIIAKF